MPRAHPGQMPRAQHNAPWTLNGGKPLAAWDTESNLQDQVLSLQAEVKHLKKENKGLQEGVLPQLQQDLVAAQSEAGKAKEHEEKCKQLTKRMQSLSAERDDLEVKLRDNVSFSLIGDSEKRDRDHLANENRRLREGLKRFHNRNQELERQVGALMSVTGAGDSPAKQEDFSHRDAKWAKLVQERELLHSKTREKVEELIEENKSLASQLANAQRRSTFSNAFALSDDDRDASPDTKAIESVKVEVNSLRKQLTTADQNLQHMREMPLKSFWLGLDRWTSIDRRCRSARGGRSDEARLVKFKTDLQPAASQTGSRSPSPSPSRRGSHNPSRQSSKEHSNKLAPIAGSTGPDRSSGPSSKEYAQWEVEKEAFLRNAQKEADRLKKSAAAAQHLLLKIEEKKAAVATQAHTDSKMNMAQDVASRMARAAERSVKMKLKEAISDGNTKRHELEQQLEATTKRAEEAEKENDAMTGQLQDLKDKNKKLQKRVWLFAGKAGCKNRQVAKTWENIVPADFMAEKQSSADTQNNSTAQRTSIMVSPDEIASIMENHEDPQDQVKAFLESACHKTITKEDVVYETEPCDEGQRCTLTVRCLDGAEVQWEFIGDDRLDTKDAEEAAAEKAMEYFSQVVAEQHASALLETAKAFSERQDEESLNALLQTHWNDTRLREILCELYPEGAEELQTPDVDKDSWIRDNSKALLEKLQENTEETQAFFKKLDERTGSQDVDKDEEQWHQVDVFDSLHRGRSKTDQKHKMTQTSDNWHNTDDEPLPEWKVVIERLSRALFKEHTRKTRESAVLTEKEMARLTKGIYEFISDWAHNQEFEQQMNETIPNLKEIREAVAASRIQFYWRTSKVRVGQSVRVFQRLSHGMGSFSDSMHGPRTSGQISNPTSPENDENPLQTVLDSATSQLASDSPRSPVKQSQSMNFGEGVEREKTAEEEAREEAMELMAAGYLEAFEKAGGQVAVNRYSDDVNEAIRFLKSLRTGQDCKQDCAFELLDLDELFMQTERRSPDFLKEVQRFAEATGGLFVPGSLKGRRRTRTKCFMKFGNDASCLNDLMRASISYVDIDTLYAAVLRLLTSEEDLYRKDFCILHIDDRIQKPAAGNYRDVQLVVQFDGMAAEVQFHLEDLLHVKKQHGHGGYEQQRALCESLFMAAVQNKTSYVQALLHQFPQAVQMSKDKNGRRALHYGCGHGSFSVVKSLLEYEADPWWCDDEEVLPVELAFQNRYWHVAAIVLTCMGHRRAQSPVHQPRQFRRLASMAQWWIDHIGHGGQDLDLSRHAATKLCHLLNSNPEEAVLQHDHQSPIASKLRTWLLHHVEKGNHGCVKAMLEMSVLPSKPGPGEQRSPLEVALSHGSSHLEIAKLLTDANVVYLCQHHSLEGHLLQYAREAKWESVSVALQLRADPKCTEQASKRTPLMLAAASGEVEACDELLNWKADLHAEDLFCARAIDYACAMNRGGVQTLLGATEMRMNTMQEHEELVDRMAVIVAMNEPEDDRIHGTLDSIDESNSSDSSLSATEADKPRRGNRFGVVRRQGLHEVAFRGCVGALALLQGTTSRTDDSANNAPIRQLKYKKNYLNEQIETGASPLICAVESAHVLSVDPQGYMTAGLLAARADVEVVDKRKWTALHWAAMRMHSMAYNALKKANASEEAQNLEGETPVELMQRAERYQARHALNSYVEEQKRNDLRLMHAAFFALHFQVILTRHRSVEDVTDNLEALRLAKERIIAEQAKKIRKVRSSKKHKEKVETPGKHWKKVFKDEEEDESPMVKVPSKRHVDSTFEKRSLDGSPGKGKKASKEDEEDEAPMGKVASKRHLESTLEKRSSDGSPGKGKKASKEDEEDEAPMVKSPSRRNLDA